jgi:hypothetical protein
MYLFLLDVRRRVRSHGERELFRWRATPRSLPALDLEGSPPAGARIIRIAGPQGGGRRIRGIWDSDTDYERFRDSKLVPALRGLGRALEVIEAWPATETVRVLHVT